MATTPSDDAAWRRYFSAVDAELLAARNSRILDLILGRVGKGAGKVDGCEHREWPT